METTKVATTMKCNFMFSHYEEILEEAIRLGYTLTSFKSYVPSMKRAIILRHDIDFSMGILPLAQIEQKHHATATYFVRIHSRHYNPFSYDNHKVFSQLVGMGHEIGLHIDGLAFVGLASKDLVSEVKKEKQVLETMLGIVVESASMHGFRNLPKPDYFGLDTDGFGIRNYAYASRFTKAMKYISDSAGHWREGCICELLGKHDKIQVLTHPEWWYQEEANAYDRW